MSDFWTTRSEHKLLVSDMSNAHLENAINMLLRHKRLIPNALAIEAEKRGMDTWCWFGEAEFFASLSYYDDLHKV